MQQPSVALNPEGIAQFPRAEPGTIAICFVAAALESVRSLFLIDLVIRTPKPCLIVLGWLPGLLGWLPSF
jgi:hypothetical protein